jgi:hypothetical protein
MTHRSHAHPEHPGYPDLPSEVFVLYSSAGAEQVFTSRSLAMDEALLCAADWPEQGPWRVQHYRKG